MVLERNDAYWGDKPHWQKVTWKPVSSEGPRVAALLAGDVDVIENPPIQDFDRIKGAGFQIVQGISNRIIYLHMDQYSDPAWKTPGVKGTDKNPFLDKRVREAVSKAINRRRSSTASWAASPSRRASFCRRRSSAPRPR